MARHTLTKEQIKAIADRAEGKKPEIDLRAESLTALERFERETLPALASSTIVSTNMEDQMSKFMKMLRDNKHLFKGNPDAQLAATKVIAKIETILQRRK